MRQAKICLLYTSYIFFKLFCEYYNVSIILTNIIRYMPQAYQQSQREEALLWLTKIWTYHKQGRAKRLYSEVALWAGLLFTPCCMFCMGSTTTSIILKMVSQEHSWNVWQRTWRLIMPYKLKCFTLNKYCFWFSGCSYFRHIDRNSSDLVITEWW